MKGRGGVGLVAGGFLAFILAGLLAGLGFWQLNRLAWKEGLIAQIEARAHAAPVALPPETAWAGLDPADYEYRHVTLSGVFEHDKEAYSYRPGGSPPQPGYLVMTPLRLAGGSHVIVNRGFVPVALKEPASRPSGQVSGAVTITGLMRGPEERNAFTPADQPDKRLWYTRDPAGMAAGLGLTRAAPFTVDADGAPNPGGWPQGGATIVSFPNNHLSYAWTWFGLSATLIVVFALFAAGRLRARP